MKQNSTPDPAGDRVDPSFAPVREPWVTPTFERLSLSDAMAGMANLGSDMACS